MGKGDEDEKGCPWKIQLAIHFHGFMHLQIQPTHFPLENTEKQNSRKFQKAKLVFAVHWQLFTYIYTAFTMYLHFIQSGSSSAQLLSRVQLFVTPWTAVRQASLYITNSQSLLKLMSIELVMPSNHLILCCPLLLLPSIFPSIRVFSNESVLHIRWPRYWSFSFSISLSNEYSALISFRMNWLDLLAVQGTLKSLL